jgi:perosamine synthetase
MKTYPISKPTITSLEIDSVMDAVSSGWVSSIGPYIDEFESGMAKICQTKHSVSTSNGTTGLFLALKSLGIGDGDEVIVPDFSFIATANAVRHTGATPIFVDIDPVSLCIAPSNIERSITKNTKAIMPVHIYGHPAPMHEIMDIASKHGLYVVEDCAEAHGAKVMGRPVGSWGDMGVFSFYGNKIITTGEGGVIVTSNDSLAVKLKYMRDHAMSKSVKYWHTEIGYNFRLTNIQAALGVAQLKRLDLILNKKKQIYEWYKNELGNVKGISLNRSESWAAPVYWMICLEINGASIEQRNDVITKLGEMGVETRPYFYPMSDMPMYERANTEMTHRIYATGINLPSYFDLDIEDVIHIAGMVKEVL